MTETNALLPPQDDQEDQPDPFLDIVNDLVFEGNTEPAFVDTDDHYDPSGAQWFDRYVAAEEDQPLAPFMHPLPREITGARKTTSGEYIPNDLFNTVALPRLRAMFPYYYAEQQRAAKQNGSEIEISAEQAFEAEAVMLKFLLGSSENAIIRARRIGGIAVVTLDNDITLSWKRDTEDVGGIVQFTGDATETDADGNTKPYRSTALRAWDTLSDGQRRSAYHKIALQELDATVIRPAAIVGIASLKEEYRDEIHLGVFSSNVQDYLDLLGERINTIVHSYLETHGRYPDRFVGEAFDSDLMVSYTDGRFTDIIEQEKQLTKANKNAATAEERRKSPTLREMLSTDISYAYEDADRYVNFSHPDNSSISAQDLKVAVLLHMKDEEFHGFHPSQIERVHFDDMKSALRRRGPRLTYVRIPPSARFTTIETPWWKFN